MPETAALPGAEPSVMARWEPFAIVRYPSSPRAVRRHPLLRKDEKLWPARIQDVATEGVSLVLQRGFPRGAILMVMLRSTCEKSFFRTIAVMVVRARRQAEGTWLVDCTFIGKLTEAARDGLLCQADGQPPQVNPFAVVIKDLPRPAVVVDGPVAAIHELPAGDGAIGQGPGSRSGPPIA